MTNYAEILHGFDLKVIERKRRRAFYSGRIEASARNPTTGFMCECNGDSLDDVLKRTLARLAKHATFH